MAQLRMAWLGAATAPGGVKQRGLVIGRVRVYRVMSGLVRLIPVSGLSSGAAIVRGGSRVATDPAARREATGRVRSGATIGRGVQGGTIGRGVQGATIGRGARSGRPGPRVAGGTIGRAAVASRGRLAVVASGRGGTSGTNGAGRRTVRRVSVNRSCPMR